MQQITVAGRPARRLTAELRPGKQLNADKNGEAACIKPFRAGIETTAGITATLHGDYVLLDTPGAGVTGHLVLELDHPDKDVLLDSMAYPGNHMTIG